MPSSHSVWTVPLDSVRVVQPVSESYSFVHVWTWPLGSVRDPEPSSHQVWLAPVASSVVEQLVSGS